MPHVRPYAPAVLDPVEIDAVAKENRVIGDCVGQLRSGRVGGPHFLVESGRSATNPLLPVEVTSA
jgi:hypothetical protein